MSIEEARQAVRNAADWNSAATLEEAMDTLIEAVREETTSEFFRPHQVRSRITELEAALRKAIEDQIWMSGGWNDVPAETLALFHANVASAREALGESGDG
jgi:hypothetical protein